MEESSISSISHSINKVDKIYNEEYYSKYGHNYVPYKQNAAVMNTLDEVTRALLKIVHPKTHLDVGCAMGFMVRSMRKRGIESYGIEPSTFAFSNVVVESRRFVKHAGIFDLPVDDLPKRFDLVTCVEVVEHLDPSEEDAAIDVLCGLSDLVYFTSAYDTKDRTHFNAQPMVHWINAFAKRGYVPVSAVSPHIPWGRLYVKAKSYKDLSNLLENTTRVTVVIRDGMECVVCGKTGVHIHEIVPRSAFGKRTMQLCFDERNRVCLCPKHHEEAHTVEMRKSLLALLKEKYDYNYPEQIFRKYME
jgi:SAM-dependent methyltransferase